MSNKTVYVIFKNHLDVGFTDYAQDVVDKYLDTFIPNAIKTGYELKDTETPFVWTLGSWMIDRALKEDKTGEVEKAIKDGILSWHGMPYTSHTEAMSPTLFKYGLDITQKLDKRFGKKTTGAKMTDVPGHTLGMVPLMADAGITFLHLGVNPATPVPKVPPIFRWECDGKSIIIMYQGDYGHPSEVEDFVIYFAHTYDNCGPQSTQEVIEVYENIKKQYPGYTVKAATMSDVAQRVCQVENLPVIDKEIGDTWIHGIGTDPVKLSRYRKLLRHIENINLDNVDISDNLLLIPEHTWGMDVKTHFGISDQYTHIQMEQMKPQRAKIEKAWQEQRDYATKAENLLGVECDYPISEPNLANFERCDFNGELPFEISWELYSNEDYERYKKDYMRLHKDIEWWALGDFTKEKLPDYQGGIFAAKVTESYVNNKGDKLYKMEFPNAEEYGLPYIYALVEESLVTLKWFNKKDSRLPQAFWIKFKNMDEKWELNKMGRWIKPDDVIDSRLICTVDKGVRNKEVEIYPVDSALVAPYGRRLLQYTFEELPQDLYFNLYNNIWNTNFPMWYSDDSMFRFEIKKR